MAPLQSLGRSCGAIAGLALLCGTGGGSLHHLVQQDDFRAAQLVSPTGLATSIPELPAAMQEPVIAVYDGVFRGTVYYTPTESGFTIAAGFDMSPATKPNLDGKCFPKDFLKAVELEGFGRMKSPVNGKWYVSCCRGRWAYADQPVGSKGQPLKALRSTAVGADYQLVRSEANFRIEGQGLPKEFINARWEVCDTGSGLGPGQIDFYWGEDEPLGPGAQLSRPKRMPHPIQKPTVLVLR